MAIVTDIDLAAFLGNTSLVGDPQAQIATAMASGVISALLSNEALGDSVTYVDRILDGSAYGSNVLILPGFPITSVASISITDFTNTNTWQTPLVEGKDYSWNTNGVVSRVLVNDGAFGFGFWPNQAKSIKITFTSGFGIPDAVKALTLGMAARAYTNPAGLTSESISGYSSQFSKNPQMFMAVDPMEMASVAQYIDWGIA